MEKLNVDIKYEIEQSLNHLAHVLRKIGVSELTIDSNGEKIIKWDCFEGGMIDTKQLEKLKIHLMHFHKHMPLEIKTKEQIKAMSINDLNFYLEIIQSQPNFNTDHKLVELEDVVCDQIKKKHGE